MELLPAIKAFRDLTVDELYAILKLRNEVFIMEQNCLYHDLDDKDQRCYHLMLQDSKGIAAYARLVPPGVSYLEMSIGRVVTAPYARGTGAGKALMEQAIEKCSELFGSEPIRIGAQCYLKRFYTSFGFQEVGEEYDEDGIMHIEMIKTIQS